MGSLLLNFVVNFKLFKNIQAHVIFYETCAVQINP